MKATTTTTTDRKQTFADLLREYEQQATTRTTESTYTKALTDLATAVAYSVLKKCIETSQSPALIQLKRDIARDTATLDRIQYAQSHAYGQRYNKDGEQEQVILDKDLHKALTDLCGQSFGDGLDLVNDAIVCILSETEKAKDRNNGQLPPCFMEQVYQVRRLNRKVWINTADSVNGWQTVDTTAIQETYKAVRRAIEQSRAVESTSKYTYLQDLATDTESESTETIYRRLPKYADLGGQVTDFNGKETAYTADTQTVQDYDTLIARLNLTKRESTILQLRLSGYGYKAIATYMGISVDNAKRCGHRLREKATAIGFVPCTK